MNLELKMWPWKLIVLLNTPLKELWRFIKFWTMKDSTLERQFQMHYDVYWRLYEVCIMIPKLELSDEFNNRLVDIIHKIERLRNLYEEEMLRRII